MSLTHDVARIRLDNALLLFDEFVRASAAMPDTAVMRGLERRFAERLQIQPSYWSQLKSRSRQIGERLARQFEQLCRKPAGWMDIPHPSGGIGDGSVQSPNRDARPSSLAMDDDERFIVGLVLTYYRRHPQRARTRLLDLLGEVLTPSTSQPVEPAAAPAPGKPPAKTSATKSPPAATDAHALWLRSQAGVAPLRQKK